MKSEFGQIIHDGDIDFSIAWKYILKYWYIVMAFALIGVMAGAYKAKKEVTTYTIQAIFEVPESWEYADSNAQVVLHGFAKQFSKANPDYEIDVKWATRPLDLKGNTIEAIVYAERTDLTQAQGKEAFTKFINELSESPQVQQMNEKASKQIDSDIVVLQKEISEIKKIQQSYGKGATELQAFNKEVEINNKIIELNNSKKQIGVLKWLTEPSPANVNKAKPWYFFVIVFAILFKMLGLFIATIPGLIQFGNGKKK